VSGGMYILCVEVGGVSTYWSSEPQAFGGEKPHCQAEATEHGIVYLFFLAKLIAAATIFGIDGIDGDID
jgi:hypothetical protein